MRGLSRRGHTGKQLWWLTAGLALTLWELSAATPVTMLELDRVFRHQRRRGLLELLPRSLSLGAATGVCVVSAIAIVRFGPLPWVSLGTGLVLGASVLTSIAFGLYATYVASYTSVFGRLASVFVVLIYVWLSANAFLVGIQLDGCVRERA